MSIASEFDSTIENIKSDYEGLENIGADLTNVNKNIQNIRTCLDNIYTNLPKTTGEGSNLSLNTLKGRINVDDILGDTEQYTTTGINLFIPSLKNVETNTTITKSNAVSSLTLSNNEFTFVASGADVYFGQVTAVGGNYSNANGNKINVGSATKISYRLTNTTFNRGHFTAYDSNNVSLGYTGIQGSTGTYTIPSGTSYVTFRFGKNGATSGTTYKTKVIVALGDTIPDYQDYTGGQASPNPTYPQDINVVTGTQEVVVQNKNLCDGQFRQGGWHDTSGTTRLFTTQNLVVKQGTTLTISTTLDTTQYKYGVVIGKLPYPQTTNPNIYDIGWNTTSSKTITFNVSGYDIGYLGITIATANGTDSLTPSDIASAKWQVEYGSTATSYTPHQEQTKTLHLGDIELSKIGTYQDRIFESSGKQMLNVTATSQTKNNIVFTIDNGVVKANGTGNSSTGLVLGQVQLEAGKTYYLSGCASGGGSGKYTLSINAENDTTRLADDTGSGASYTPSTSGTYDIRLNYWYNYAISNLTFYPMINEGSTALPYEPYGSDKWYIEKKMYKIANKTNWVVGNMASNNRCPIPLNSNGLADTINNYSGINCISNCLIATSQGTQATSTDINTISINNANAYVKFDDATNTRELVKTKLDSMTNFVLYYILITPTYTEITNETLLNELNELEKMMSYNGQTNISVSGNLPMILDISALKGE